MTEWYYGQSGAPQGPVADTDLRAKFAGGEITGETLVWCDGMADWKRYADVFLAAPAGTGDDATLTPAPSAGQYPPVSRPVSESPYATPASAFANFRAEESYKLHLGDYLGNAWSAMIRQFWPVFGAGAVIQIIWIVVSQFSVPILFLYYPLIAGMYVYGFLCIRNQTAPFEKIFDGFRSFGQLALMNLVHFLAIGIPMGIVIVLAMLPGMINESEEIMGGGFLAALVVLLPVGCFLGMVSTIAMMLCVDRGIEWAPATVIAWKTVKKRWLAMAGLYFLFGLLGSLGLLLCFVGLFITWPWMVFATCCLYDDIFRQIQPESKRLEV